MKAPTLDYRQFSLRFAFIVTTALSIPLGIYANHLAGERRLLAFIEHYNAALDDEQYAEADAIASETVAAFPNHPIAQYVMVKQQAVRDMLAGKPMTGGFSCQ
jgi:hypothetical protein